MNHFMRLFFLSISGALLLPLGFLWAQEKVDALEGSIKETAVKIDQLREGIKKDEENLNRLVGEKQTLSSVISNLSYSENKLSSELEETEGQIDVTESEIDKLNKQSEALGETIGTNADYIRNTLWEIHKESDTGIWEAFLLFDTFSQFLEQTTALVRTGDVLKNNLLSLQKRKEEIQVINNKKSIAKFELEQQFENLDDRKKIIAYTKNQKNQLLQATKNQEKNYQAILKEKRRDLAEFNRRMTQLERELVIAIDESRVQKKLSGLFSWPFSGWYRISQYFGNTSYASGGAYNGRGHSGVDFATPMGTPIRAVMDGVVTAADDTGKYGATINGRYQRCVSYGKWIVIDHQNGLSTRINHLSGIKVQDGQSVSRGQIVGYSGNTGISTGPHLHLSVMATQGVQIRRLGEVMQTRACAQARAPITASNAYKDPFDYLSRPHYGLKTVSVGDSGRDVRNLQMMLKHERIFPIEISANGVYGPTTAKAVLAWQKKYRVASVDVLEEGRGENFDEDSLERYEDLF